MANLIREIKESEIRCLLHDFLYEAIFIPKRIQAPPKLIINSPDLQIDISDLLKEKKND